MRLWVGLLAATVTIAIPALGCGLGGKHSAEMETLGTACAGTPVAEAPAYTGGGGPHPMMAFIQRPNSRYRQAFGMLTTRTPGGHDIASTQLLLCMDLEQSVELERCYFDTQLRVGFIPVPGARTGGPSFPRVRVQRRVRVVAASTGQTIAETTLTGSEPPPCDHPIVGDPSDGDFRGGDVSDHEVNVWAEPYALGNAP